MDVLLQGKMYKTHTILRLELDDPENNQASLNTLCDHVRKFIKAC